MKEKILYKKIFFNNDIRLLDILIKNVSTK